MARAERKLSVSALSDEGGRSSLDVSLDDPTFDPEAAYNNRLKFIFNQAPSPDLQQQDAAQMLQNQQNPYIGPAPDVENSPSVTPFPVGCPTGFYQQGSVCIPMIGTFPDATTGAPPAGQNFAKGTIQQVVPPTMTSPGQLFQVRIYIENIGAVRGKFFASISSPDLQLNADPTAGVWVPAFSNAIIYKNLPMPQVATMQVYNASVVIQHLDETSGKMVSDDTQNFTIPGPGVVVPPTTTPPPGGGGTTTTPPPPSTVPPSMQGNAVILTTPQGTVRDNSLFAVNGFYFRPREPVIVRFSMVAHGLAQWEGRIYHANFTTYADIGGRIYGTVHTPAMPAGVQGAGTVTATGGYSQQSATTTIEVS